MIIKFEAEELNGFEKIELTLNNDLNIFTGTNGCGKTTLLKAMWYMQSGNIDNLKQEFNYKSVKLTTDKYILEIKSKDDSISEEFDDDDIILTSNNQIQTFDSETPGFKRHLFRYLFRETSSIFLPTFRRIEGGFNKKRSIGLSGRHSSSLNLSNFAEELSSPNHIFITAQSTDDLENLFNRKFSEISEKTNKIHTELSQKINLLIKNNKLKNDPSTLNSIEDLVAKSDAERDKLLNPLIILKELSHQIFKDKNIKLTEGFVLGSEESNIDASKLSAGEKQMLSFLCYNAFYENTTIYIDEPELSLHIDWQRSLFKLLLQQNSTNQFIIATHSPFIYTKFRDKEIEIGITDDEAADA